MGRLDDKVALISGGARGQGAAEARLFANEGAKVIFGDVLDELGQQVEAEIRELGRRGHLPEPGRDQRSPVERRRGRRRQPATASWDILVNNAGVVSWGVLEDTSEEEWDRVMDVNAKGVFLGTRASIPEMRRAGRGLHHQHLLNLGHHRPGRHPAGVQCLQRGGALVDQVHRHPVRPGGHPGQLGTSGVGGYRHETPRGGLTRCSTSAAWTTFPWAESPSRRR